MKKNNNIELICLIKGKLIALDNIAPLILKLIHLDVIKNVTLFSTEGTDLHATAEVIYRYFFKTYKIKIISPKERESSVQIFLRKLKVIFLFRKIFYKKILFIGGDELGVFAQVTMFINKIMFKGCILQNNLSPYDIATFRNINRVMIKHYSRLPFRIKNHKCDAIITTIPLSEYRALSKINSKIINIGYTRTFPEWLKFIDKYYQENSTDIEKYGDFFFWPLSVLKRTEPNGESIDFGIAILNVLNILYEANCKLKVVFRYHPTTNRKQMEDILKKSKYKNIAFSYDHPHILIKKSKFIFSTIGTTLFCDAWNLKKTVVQFNPDENVSAERNTQGKLIASTFKPVVDHFIAYDKKKFILLLKKLEKNTGFIERSISDIKKRNYSITNSKLIKELELY